VLLAVDPGQRFVEAISHIVDAPHVWLMLPDDSGGLAVARTFGADLGDSRIGQDDSTLAGAAFVSGRAQIVADWTTHPTVTSDRLQQMVDAGVADARSAVFIPLETPDGPAGVVSVLLRKPITANNADVLGLLGLLAAEAGIAITRDALAKRLADEARTDPLTGTANRRVWAEVVEQELERAKRTSQPLAVALLDLDFFKRYNDSFGHSAGDEVLRAVADAWTSIVRPTDLLARLGGEEFGVLLPDTDLDAAVAIMERLRAAVPSDQTASIGVTTHRPGEDIATTLDRADHALYAAKSAGRNRVVSG
jgi:diguanylate cyclase (GGDEF)-like protein